MLEEKKDCGLPVINLFLQVSITIRGLRVEDSGAYHCALNLKSHVVKVVHTLQIEGKYTSLFATKLILEYF